MLEEARRQTLAARALSRETGTLFTQECDCHTRNKRRLTPMLWDCFGPDALLSYATNLTEREIAMCAETDTRIAHNPSAAFILAAARRRNCFTQVSRSASARCNGVRPLG